MLAAVQAPIRAVAQAPIHAAAQATVHAAAQATVAGPRPVSALDYAGARHPRTGIAEQGGN